MNRNLRFMLEKTVKPHWNVPDTLLDQMAELPNFSVAYVLKAARRMSSRYPREKFNYRKLAQMLRETAKRHCDMIMSGEFTLNVIFAGGILESNMVADALEKMERENPDPRKEIVP